MIRLIKRYGSRKLYDTEESRYASLEEIAGWIREGQQIQVVDNKSGEDVTVQTLGQIIAEEGKRGRSVPPSELLHELIAAGGEALSSGVERIGEGAGRLLQAGVDRLGPVRRMREETEVLRGRLEELEAALETLEKSGAGRSGGSGRRRKARKNVS
jgi:polyhydroxyalkanoate synthesis repressor PhaR